jgi:hypothetical protein
LHLYVSSGGNASGAIVCLGAELATNAPATQTVVTPEGVGIGDTVQHLKAVYGNRAQFVPAPATGLSPRAGYLVTEPRFNLAFVVDSTNTHVTGIKAGLTVFSPSSCAG